MVCSPQLHLTELKTFLSSSLVVVMSFFIEETETNVFVVFVRRRNSTNVLSQTKVETKPFVTERHRMGFDIQFLSLEMCQI